jgi:hypothetical protein
VDDNCDGLVDCADPQCTGGGSPVAECVPDPGATTTSGMLAPGTCPGAYPTATALGSGDLDGGSCGAGSCACANGVAGMTPPTCSASIVAKGNAMACIVNMGTTIFTGTSAQNCVAIGQPLTSTSFYAVTLSALSATCNPATGGAASKTPPTWSNNANFCSGYAVGAGCAAGELCVPAAATHCVLEMGDQAACNVPGYGTQDTTQYFAGFDDSTRDCTCNCNLTGSCPGVAAVGTGTCNLAINAGCQNGLSGDHVQIEPPTGVGCTPGATSAGSTSTTSFARTVCCTK